MTQTKIKLWKMIFDYWRIHITTPDDYFKVSYQNGDDYFASGVEDLHWYDGWNAGFWYILNIEWYRFNNKLYARTGCKYPFDGLRDFDDDYLKENDYV